MVLGAKDVAGARSIPWPARSVEAGDLAQRLFADIGHHAIVRRVAGHQQDIGLLAGGMVQQPIEEVHRAGLMGEGARPAWCSAAIRKPAAADADSGT